jgi:hypothetical protein
VQYRRGVKPYLELPELAEIVLEESWVRGVVAEPGVVRFDVEFVLTERHPHYRAPFPNELFCHNRGTLLISGVTRSVWAAQGAPPAHDANGETDFGHIDALTWDAEHLALEGDWGQMELDATSIQVQLGSVQVG